MLNIYLEWTELFVRGLYTVELETTITREKISHCISIYTLSH